MITDERLAEIRNIANIVLPDYCFPFQEALRNLLIEYDNVIRVCEESKRAYFSAVDDLYDMTIKYYQLCSEVELQKALVRESMFREIDSKMCYNKLEISSERKFRDQQEAPQDLR